MTHTVFHYPTLADASKEAEKLGVFLPLRQDTAALFAPLAIGNHAASNRIAFQPMEGTDGTLDGAPGEWTRRRYLRFAQGGPGLIWFEAVATVPEAQASAHQLRITEENLDNYKKLLDEVRETSLKENSYAAILSNPPYIPEADIAGLAPEVRCKEPLTALSGGTDGLDFYRRLCQEAPAMLVDGGFMAFEVGIHQAQDVAALAAANPLIGRTEIIKDYAGIERVVVAWRQAE